MVTFKIYGKRLQFANLKMAIEIVDFPSYKMVDLSIVMGQFTANSHKLCQIGLEDW